MTSSSETRNGTECTVCPPWVLRCAHYGDQWVALHPHPNGSGFAICVGQGPPVDAGGMHGSGSFLDEQVFYRDDADAKFDEVVALKLLERAG